MSRTINFHSEGIDYSPTLPHLDNWLSLLLTDVGNRSTWSINYIFCDDSYLHKINVEYLSHDTYTDIITFPLEVNAQHIGADIFISIDRVKDNASQFNVEFDKELLRVMAHGILHLVGYQDKSEDDMVVMRTAENSAISKYYDDTVQ